MHLRDYELAMDLLEEMVDMGMPANAEGYATGIRTCARCSKSDEAVYLYATQLHMTVIPSKVRPFHTSAVQPSAEVPVGCTLVESSSMRSEYVRLGMFLGRNKGYQKGAWLAMSHHRVPEQRKTTAVRAAPPHAREMVQLLEKLPSSNRPLRSVLFFCTGDLQGSHRSLCRLQRRGEGGLGP